MYSRSRHLKLCGLLSPSLSFSLSLTLTHLFNLASLACRKLFRVAKAHKACVFVHSDNKKMMMMMIIIIPIPSQQPYRWRPRRCSGCPGARASARPGSPSGSWLTASRWTSPRWTSTCTRWTSRLRSVLAGSTGSL